MKVREVFERFDEKFEDTVNKVLVELEATSAIILFVQYAVHHYNSHDNIRSSSAALIVYKEK